MFIPRLIRALRPLAAVLAVLAGQGALPGATINAVADTTLRSNSPNTSFGGDSTINVGDATSSSSLVLFDLTPYAGQTVTGPATLRLRFASYGLGDTQGFIEMTAYRALVAWNESTTFNTFGPAAGITGGVDYDTTGLGSMPLTFISLQGAMDVPIGASVLQGWIDNPGSNFGFFMAGNGVNASSDETALPPQLLFDSILTPPDTDPGPDPEPGAVPEPATSALVAGGLAAAVVLRRRARR